MSAPKLPSVKNFASATLEAKRLDSGISMYDLAAKLGVTVVQLGNWERGTEPMPREVFTRWLALVGVKDLTVARLLMLAHADAERAG